MLLKPLAPARTRALLALLFASSLASLAPTCGPPQPRLDLSCEGASVSVTRNFPFPPTTVADNGCDTDLNALLRHDLQIETSTFWHEASSVPTDLAAGPAAAITHLGKIAGQDEPAFVAQNANRSDSFVVPGLPGGTVPVQVRLTTQFDYFDPGLGLPVDDPDFANRETAIAELDLGGGILVDIIATVAALDADGDGNPDGSTSGTFPIDLDAGQTYFVDQTLNITYLKVGVVTRTQRVEILLP